CHITKQPDRQCLAPFFGIKGFFNRFIQVFAFNIAIACFNPPINTLLIYFYPDTNGVIHRSGQWLRSAHTTQPGRYQQFTLQRSVKLLAGTLCKSFVSTLQNTLRTNINPGTRRHLSIHRQSHFIETTELFPVGPLWYQMSIRDKHAGSFFVGFKYSHRLPALNQHSFIIFQTFERFYYLVIAFPIASRLSPAAIDNQLLRLFSNRRIKIIHQHAQRCFLMPPFAIYICSCWCFYTFYYVFLSTHHPLSLN